MKIIPTVVLLCGVVALPALGQTNPASATAPALKQGGPKQKAKKEQREPTWKMTRVEGPNLHYKTFDSGTAGEPVSYLLYLPPGYDAAKDRRYPVTYWLHGIGGSQQGMPVFCARLTKAIEDGKAPAMIVVFVNGMVDSFYCDAINARRPVETVAIKELIPHVDATYRTIATREGRMIEGFSMGGFGAAHFGFKYPDLFGSISIIDGALLGLDEIKKRHQVQFHRIWAGSDEKFRAESPFWLTENNAGKIRGRTVIRVAVGMIVGPNALYHQLLDRQKIVHDYTVHDGAGHNHAKIYERLGEKNWAFYRNAFAGAGSSSAPK